LISSYHCWSNFVLVLLIKGLQLNFWLVRLLLIACHLGGSLVHNNNCSFSCCQ